VIVESEKMAAIDTELREIVDERKQIWKQFGQSMGIGNELTQLSGQIPTQPAQPRGPLTSTQASPDELSAALQLVKQSLENSAVINTSIQQKQAQIAQLKQRDKNIVIGLAIAVVVAILVLWATITSH
jgi:hypothetical protein